MWRILLCVFMHIQLTLQASSGCGGPRDLTGMEGVIRSQPEGQSRYSNNTKCTWNIEGRPGQVVRLHFEAFQVESCVNCRCDFLEVYDIGVRREKLCGSNRPSDITSNGQTLTLKFTSDSSAEMRGFRIRFALVGCGGTRELTGVEGVISSQPEGQRKYSDNSNCTWVIKGRPGMLMIFHFEVFEIEKCQNCSCDYLEVSGNTNTKLCGSDLPGETFLEFRQSLTLKFKSDSSRNYKGFRIRLTFVDKRCKTIAGNTSQKIIAIADDSNQFIALVSSGVINALLLLIIILTIVVLKIRKRFQTTTTTRSVELKNMENTQNLSNVEAENEHVMTSTNLSGQTQPSDSLNHEQNFDDFKEDVDEPSTRNSKRVELNETDITQNIYDPAEVGNDHTNTSADTPRPSDQPHHLGDEQTCKGFYEDVEYPPLSSAK